MAAPYRIYFVGTFKTKSGKGAEAAKWWQEKGKAWFESTPGTKSLRVYAVQFGLGPEYFLEVWQETENYGAMDRWDEDFVKRADYHWPLMQEMTELFEFGPSRVMGDWPESRLGLGE